MKPLTLSALVFFFSPLAHANLPDDVPSTPAYGPSVPACSNNGVDISTDSSAILEAIKGAQACWQAVQLAENCGSGDRGDVQLVSLAKTNCRAELTNNRPQAREKALLSSMEKACESKWKGRAGSENVSRNAYCQLKALQWIVNLTELE